MFGLFGLCFVLFSSRAFSGWYDSGYIEFRQPDRTPFIGREYGDEFIYYRETESGHRYIRESDGWYYYAIVDGNGDLVSSGNRVGIDGAPAQSYQTEYAGAKLQEIETRRAEFETQVALAGQLLCERVEQARTQGVPATMKLGVILVEFQDSTHYDPNEPPRIGGYLKADFDSMLFSESFWYKPNPTPQDPSPPPETHAVFGSMRDYYWQMSRANGHLELLLFPAL
jgi:hypothetical protein